MASVGLSGSVQLVLSDLSPSPSLPTQELAVTNRDGREVWEENKFGSDSDEE